MKNARVNKPLALVMMQGRKTVNVSSKELRPKSQFVITRE